MSSLAGEGESSGTILLFPEGTDLSDQNLERSHAHSEKEGLPKYMQVLHPRTAGFDTTWKAMKEVAKKAAKNPPWLVDITVAYLHHVPGELPSETKFFGKGECVKEVHMMLQPISLNEQGEPTKSFTDLWQEKEEMGGNMDC